MKIALIFTNDWELFGDGSGDYFEIQQHPLSELLNLFDEQNIKMTIMAEVAQQWKHIEFSQKHESLKNIVYSWENTLIDALKNNHDIQLHIHPQWLNCDYKNGQWVLGENWSIGLLDENIIREILKRGKDYLESVLKPHYEKYSCSIFRAGAYYIEPSDKVVNALLTLGFRCDTSVTKGLSSPNYFDFRDAYSDILPWYTKNNSIKYKGKKGEGVLEIPINSFTKYGSKLLRKFMPDLFYKITYGIAPTSNEKKWMAERDRIKSIRYPVNRRIYKKNEKRNFIWYLNTIFDKNTIQLDYDYIPASAFVKYLEMLSTNKKIVKNLKSDLILPVVASGHVKDMYSVENVAWILDNIKKELNDKVEFWTLSKAVDYWENNF